MQYKNLLALAALLVGCTSTTPGPAAPSSRSLVGADPWTLTIGEGECTLTGSGGEATQGGCRTLGELGLAGQPAAAELGAKVAAMTIEREQAAGGVRAVLATPGAQYVIRYDDWSPVERQLRALLRDARIAEREDKLKARPACPTAGQVVLTYDACPPVPGAGAADVCGPPAVTCGAPLAAGAACTHHAACASGACSFEGTCESPAR